MKHESGEVVVVAKGQKGQKLDAKGGQSQMSAVKRFQGHQEGYVWLHLQVGPRCGEKHRLVVPNGGNTWAPVRRAAVKGKGLEGSDVSVNIKRLR